MLNKLVLLALVGAAAACSQAWPNGTETTMHWWQCGGVVQFFNATPFTSGGAYQYPIHLTAPLHVKADVQVNKEYTKMKSTVDIWSWGGWGGCQWEAVPTLGLLKNLEACENGVKCPISPGRQVLDVTLDFTKFESIIKLLKDDAPYQLQYVLNDENSSDSACIIAQARARTK